MRSFPLVFVLTLSLVGVAAAEPPVQQPVQKESKQDKRCEHGVKKAVCARCNPKLAPVFKARGDWCTEHERPESQCVICHPELAEKGVK